MSPGSAGQVEMCERRDKALRGCEGNFGKHGGHPAYAILSPLSQVRVLLTKPVMGSHCHIRETAVCNSSRAMVKLHYFPPIFEIDVEVESLVR